jgi:hypothetical protein
MVKVFCLFFLSLCVSLYASPLTLAARAQNQLAAGQPQAAYELYHRALYESLLQGSTSETSLITLNMAHIDLEARRTKQALDLLRTIPSQTLTPSAQALFLRLMLRSFLQVENLDSILFWQSKLKAIPTSAPNAHWIALADYALQEQCPHNLHPSRSIPLHQSILGLLCLDSNALQSLDPFAPLQRANLLRLAARVYLAHKNIEQAERHYLAAYILYEAMGLKLRMLEVQHHLHQLHPVRYEPPVFKAEFAEEQELKHLLQASNKLPNPF